MSSLNNYAETMVDFAKLLQRAGTVGLHTQSKNLAKATGAEFSISDTNTVLSAYMQTAVELASRPNDLIRFQQDLWGSSVQAWIDAWAGEDKAPKDRRFRDPAWGKDPMARGLRDGHLAMEKAVLDLLSKSLTEKVQR